MTTGTTVRKYAVEIYEASLQLWVVNSRHTSRARAERNAAELAAHFCHNGGLSVRVVSQ